MDDKQKELERIEQELLDDLLREEKEPEETPEKEEPIAPELEALEQILASDEEPLVYSNFDVEPELLDSLASEELPKKEEPTPAFEDPDRILDPKEPLVYCNFSNDYGKELEEALKEEQPEPAPEPPPRQAAAGKAKKDEKIIIGLMLAVSVLCVGILGVFIYWLETLLKLL